jgi:hypothetical protein
MWYSLLASNADVAMTNRETVNEQGGESIRRGFSTVPTFIQNANWRIFQHDTCDCYSLLLTTAV